MRRPLALPVALSAIALALAGTGTAVAASEGLGPWGGGVRSFTLHLDGDAVPDGGDPDARGFARVKLDPRHETVCLAMGWSKVDGTVTAMHIHKGEEGKTGDHVIELLNDVNLAGRINTFASCIQVMDHDGHTAKELIEAVVDDPSDYYLNVHSSKYPKGALRAQFD